MRERLFPGGSRGLYLYVRPESLVSSLFSGTPNPRYDKYSRLFVCVGAVCVACLSKIGSEGHVLAHAIILMQTFQVDMQN